MYESLFSHARAQAAYKHTAHRRSYSMCETKLCLQGGQGGRGGQGADRGRVQLCLRVRRFRAVQEAVERGEAFQQGQGVAHAGKPKDQGPGAGLDPCMPELHGHAGCRPGRRQG